MPRVVQYRIVAGYELVDSVAPLQFAPFAAVVAFVLTAGCLERGFCCVPRLKLRQINPGRYQCLNSAMLLCTLFSVFEEVCWIGGDNFSYSIHLLASLASGAGIAVGLFIWCAWGCCLLGSSEGTAQSEANVPLCKMLLTYCVSAALPALFEWLPVPFASPSGAAMCRCLGAACLSLLFLRRIVATEHVVFVDGVRAALFGLCVGRIVPTFCGFSIVSGSSLSIWWALSVYLGGAAAVAAEHYLNRGVPGNGLMRKGGTEKEPLREARLARLSKREREIVELLLEGRTASAIARSLGISVGTVGTYKSRAFSKFGLNAKDGLEALREAVGGDEGTAVISKTKRGFSRWPIALSLLAVFFIGTRFAQESPSNILIFSETICLFMSFLFGRKTMDGVTEISSPVKILGCLTMVLTVGVLYDYASGSFAGPVGLVLVWLMSPFLIMLAITVAHFGSRISGLDQASAAFMELADGEAFRALLFGVAVWEYIGQTSMVFGFGWLVVLLVCVVPLALFGCLMTEHGVSQPAVDCSDSALMKRALSYLIGRGLSETEAEVAYYTALGLSRAQISEKIHVAPGTVNAYRASSYRRLGIHSSRELRILLNDYAGQSMS